MPLGWNFTIENIDAALIQNARPMPCWEKAGLTAQQVPENPEPSWYPR